MSSAMEKSHKVMERIYMGVFILLYHEGVLSTSSCGESRDVTGVVGGEVTLHVDRAGVRDIFWVTQRNMKLVAVTKPGNVIEDITSSYKGRLSATYDGSLVITNLTTEDQGSYIANILTSGQCAQMYNLTVYGVLSKSSCGESRDVTGVVGGEVTLHVDRAGIKDIFWVSQRNKKMIATTKTGNVIEDITDSYKGRLSATCDGSLVITNLTTEDQGSYIASIMGSKQCIQTYNVTVYDSSLIRRNPKDLSTKTIIYWVLSGIVLLIACCVFIHHIMSEVLKPPDGH